MLTASRFALASCQATLFTPDEEVSAAKILTKLLPREEWSGLFNADPVTLPAIDGVPREVPRLTLASKDSTWRCEVGSARINIFWRRVRDDGEAPDVASFYRRATSLLAEYAAFSTARVGRLAAVVTRFAENPSPGLFLAKHFCQERWLKEPLNRPESFELHAHKRFSMGPFLVNSWVRSKTGVVTAASGTKPIVLVEQDLNTLSEEEVSRDFAREAVEDFFNRSAAEFGTILGLYFPEGGAS